MTPISAFQSSSWGLGHQGAKTSPSYCSLLEVITHRTGEHEESMVALSTEFGVAFYCPTVTKTMRHILSWLTSMNQIPRLATAFHHPLNTLVTSRPVELSKAAGDLQEPCYTRSRNQQPQHHLGALRTVPSWALSQTYWISICIFIRFPG